MLTAILPIRLTHPFWSSATGRDCLDRFLTMIAGMEEVGRVVLVGGGEELAGMARKYGMEFAKVCIPGRIDLPFTLDETMELAERVVDAHLVRDEPFGDP